MYSSEFQYTNKFEEFSYHNSIKLEKFSSVMKCRMKFPKKKITNYTLHENSTLEILLLLNLFKSTLLLQIVRQEKATITEIIIDY